MSSVNLVEENGMRGVKGQKSHYKFVLVEWFLFFCYNRKIEVHRKNRKRRLVMKTTGSLSVFINIIMRLSLYSVDPPEPDGESVCVDPLTGKTLAPLVQRMADRGQC